MLFWLFTILAVLAFISFFLHALAGRATMMFYTAVILCVWIALAMYFGGYNFR